MPPISAFLFRVIFLPGKPNESNEVDPHEHVCQWATLLTLSTLSTLSVGIFTKVDKVDKGSKVDKVEERFYIGGGGSSFSRGCRCQDWRNLSGQSSIVSHRAQQPCWKKNNLSQKDLSFKMSLKDVLAPNYHFLSDSLSVLREKALSWACQNLHRVSLIYFKP